MPCLRRAASASRRKTDRKSTRLNSSHSQISYAVFCLKKKKKIDAVTTAVARRDLSRIITAVVCEAMFEHMDRMSAMVVPHRSFAEAVTCVAMAAGADG